MTERDQIVHFSNDLDNLVDRYRTEYEISHAAVVGVLFMTAHLLCVEASELEEPPEG